jgi:hypothetical protein
MDARDRHVVEKQLPMPLLWIFVANAFASPWRVAPQNRLGSKSFSMRHWQPSNTPYATLFSSRTPL